jgi:hypothetical protein
MCAFICDMRTYISPYTHAAAVSEPKQLCPYTHGRLGKTYIHALLHTQSATVSEAHDHDPSCANEEARRQETSLASSLREVASFWSTQFGAAAAATPRRLRLPTKRIGNVAPPGKSIQVARMSGELDVRLLKHDLQVRV